MRFTFAIATILVVVNAYDGVDLPVHSKPWICTHAVKKVYDYSIWNGIATQGVDCFDELLTLPDKIKYMTSIKIGPIYMAVGPYIGKTKTFRVVAVLEDELENANLGTKIEGQFAVECFKCKDEHYGDNVAFISCMELTMEECPDRLSGELYWNPSGNITSSSDAEFCMYRNKNDRHEYICTIYDADLDVVC